MFNQRVVVRGGGDLGSGVSLRLHRAGFPVIILETECPIAVRRTVAFSEAVYEESIQVEEAVAVRCSSPVDVDRELEMGRIPVLVDPKGCSLSTLSPFAVVDAIMAKKNMGTHLDMAPLVVALGPGFVAGSDVHAVIETNRGPNLGRVLWKGTAEENTGEPAPVQDKTNSRVLRAPVDGVLLNKRSIGDIVDQDDVVASVDGVPVRASFHSLLRGLARDGLQVQQGMKIGDIDPRLDPSLCYRVSDKALAIAGGVLEAILMSLNESRTFNV